MHIDIHRFALRLCCVPVLCACAVCLCCVAVLCACAVRLCCVWRACLLLARPLCDDSSSHMISIYDDEDDGDDGDDDGDDDEDDSYDYSMVTSTAYGMCLGRLHSFVCAHTSQHCHTSRSHSPVFAFRVRVCRAGVSCILAMCFKITNAFL